MGSPKETGLQAEVQLGGGGVNEWLGVGVGPPQNTHHISALETALSEAV